MGTEPGATVVIKEGDILLLYLRHLLTGFGLLGSNYGKLSARHHCPCRYLSRLRPGIIAARGPLLTIRTFPRGGKP